jgi:alkylhydroperoxidase family enzyme
VDSHIAAGMRLGLDEQGVTELMAAADHARGLAKLAEGLRLEPETRARTHRPGLVREVADAEAGERVRELLEAIRGWAVPELGIARVPALWRAVAHRPVYLDALWRREQALMGDGRLTRFQKRCIGYAVSVNTVSPYMIDWYAASLRQLGLDDPGFVEVLAVVDYFNNLNTLADGMAIESDIVPYGTYE